MIDDCPTAVTLYYDLEILCSYHFSLRLPKVGSPSFLAGSPLT